MAEKSFLDNFTPKQSFVMGVVLTILALGTLGFLWSLKGGSLSLGAKAGSNNNRGAAPAAPTAAAPTQPSNAGAGSADAVRPVDDDDHIRGNVDAAITVIEYSDFECPFCQRFHPTMNQLISDNDDVRWVYRHFPLTSIHPNAQKAAEASECAAEQGEFWAYGDALFEAPSLNRAQFTSIAEQVGLNMSEFEDCLDSGDYASKVQADAANAQAAGGTGTPFSVVIGADGSAVPVSGAVPLSQLQSIVDSAR